MLTEDRKWSGIFEGQSALRNVSAASIGAISKFGVISPSLWWDNRDLTKRLYADHDWLKTCKIWFDMGTDEGSGEHPEKNVLYTRELAGIFSRAGLSEDVAYRYREFEKAKHNEQAWSERFDQVLLFLFGK